MGWGVNRGSEALVFRFYSSSLGLILSPWPHTDCVSSAWMTSSACSLSWDSRGKQKRTLKKCFFMRNKLELVNVPEWESTRHQKDLFNDCVGAQGWAAILVLSYFASRVCFILKLTTVKASESNPFFFQNEKKKTVEFKISPHNSSQLLHLLYY